MEFLPKCGCVNTTIWMYLMNTNEMHGEKAMLQDEILPWFEKKKKKERKEEKKKKTEVTTSSSQLKMKS